MPKPKPPQSQNHHARTAKAKKKHARPQPEPKAITPAAKSQPPEQSCCCGRSTPLAAPRSSATSTTSPAKPLTRWALLITNAHSASPFLRAMTREDRALFSLVIAMRVAPRDQSETSTRAATQPSSAGRRTRQRAAFFAGVVFAYTHPRTRRSTEHPLSSQV